MQRGNPTNRPCRAAVQFRAAAAWSRPTRHPGRLEGSPRGGIGPRVLAAVAAFLLAGSGSLFPQQVQDWQPALGAFGDWRWTSPRADVATIQALTGAPGQCITAIDIGVVYCWSENLLDWVPQADVAVDYWVDPDTPAASAEQHAVRLNTSTFMLEYQVGFVPANWAPVTIPTHWFRHESGGDDLVRPENQDTTCPTGEGFVSTGSAVDCTGAALSLAGHQHDAGDVTTGAFGEDRIATDAVTEPKLKAVDAPSDEECLTYETAVGDFEWQSCGGAGGSPGGSDTQVQFNDSSTFGGDADLTWDKTNNVLAVASTGKYKLGSDKCLERRDSSFWLFTACGTSLSGFIAGRTFFSTGTTGSLNLEVDIDPAATVAVRVANAKHVGWSDVSWRRSSGGSFIEPANGGSGIAYERDVPTDSPVTCNDSARGAHYFDDSLGEHCACRGATGAASWQQMDGGGAC